MAFDPLLTDEPTPGGHRPKDIDNVMIAGCSTFVISSISAYFLGALPFLLMQDTYRLVVLIASLLIGLIPVLILAFIAARKFGLPASTGVIAGSMANAIFLYLRFDQIMLGFEVREIPNPEYPPMIAWVAPLSWLLSVIVVVLASTRRSQIFGSDSDPTSLNPQKTPKNP